MMTMTLSEEDLNEMHVEMAKINFEELSLVRPGNPKAKLNQTLKDAEIRSALKAANEPITSKFKAPKRLDIKAMLNTQPEPFDFVLPALVAGTVGLILSPGGVGKSYFMLIAAISIAVGVDFLGLGKLKMGRVVIVAAEDPALAIHHRIKAIQEHLCLSEEQSDLLDANLHIYPTIGFDIDVMDRDCLQWLKDISAGARLVVLDTLTRVHSIDENKASDAKSVMFAFEKLACGGPAVVLPHHISKSATTNESTDNAQAARGSSVWPDNSRWSSFISVMSKTEAKALNIDEGKRTKYLKWNVSKQSYAAPMPDLWLERMKGGVLLPAGFATAARDKITEQVSVNYIKQSQSAKVSPDEDF